MFKQLTNLSKSILTKITITVTIKINININITQIRHKMIKIVNYNNNFKLISYWDDRLVVMSLRSRKLLNMTISLFNKKEIIIYRHKLKKFNNHNVYLSPYLKQARTTLFYCYTNNL